MLGSYGWQLPKLLHINLQDHANLLLCIKSSKEPLKPQGHCSWLGRQYGAGPH